MTDSALLGEFFQCAAALPHKTFLADEDGSITYQAAAGLVERASRALRGGSNELIVLAENSRRFVLFFAACIHAARTIHIFSKEDAAEPVFTWLQSRAPCLYEGDALDRLLQEGTLVVAASGGDEGAEEPTIGFPSSGTTGYKKLLRYRYSTIARRARLLADAYNLDESDRFLCTSSLAHAHGLMVHVVPALVLGGTLGILRLNTLTVGRIATLHRLLRPTVFSGLPSLYAMLLRFGTVLDFSGTKLVLAGSERLETSVKAEFESRYSVSMIDQFGCAETGPVYLIEHRDGGRFLGRLLPGKSVDFVATEMPGLYRLSVHSTTMVDEIVSADGQAVVPDCLVLNDLAHDDGRSAPQLVGREETILVGPHGVIGLEDIERELERHFPGALFLALRDAENGYELLYAGPQDLELCEIQRVAARAPRTVVRVQKIPRNVAGKKLRSRSLLGDRTPSA